MMQMNPLPIELKAEIASCMESVKEGWCSLEKAEHLAQLIVGGKPSLVVEIGIFGGRSLLPQAMALRYNKQGVVVGIDPWRRAATVEGGVGAENHAWWSNLELHTVHSDFMENLWRLELGRWCLPWRCGAEECFGMFQPQSIDILHVDGNHSELVSCRDLDLYLPRVRHGGYVWIDDSHWNELKAAVKRMDAELDFQFDNKTYRLYRKP